MVPKLENESEIIYRCVNGDIAAYRTVYNHYEQVLLRTGLRLLEHIEDAEDAVQITFLRLYKGIKNFRYQAKFSTYLFQIMINVCFDILRKQKRFSNVPLERIKNSYEPNYDLQMELKHAIALLPPRMKTCFVLFAIEELKQEDIAAIMNLSIGAVKSHIFQAKKRLRGLLSESNNEVG